MSDNKLKDMSQSFGYLVLLGMIVWPFMVTLGPKLEGRLAPVVVGTHLTRVVPDDETHSLVYGSSTKRRECTYLKMEWFYGEPNGQHVLLPLEIMERSRIRENGEFGFGPWRLNLNADLVRDESFALVYHRCHPLWDTVTEFWP